MDHVHQTLGCFVPEDADGDDFRWEAFGDVPRGLHGHLTRGGGEDEPHCVRPQADAQERVRLGGDAADLDEQLFVRVVDVAHGVHRAETVYPMRLRRAAARSAARTRVSPTNMASYPASARRRASSAPRMADSATATTPDGVRAARAGARSLSTSKVPRSR